MRGLIAKEDSPSSTGPANLANAPVRGTSHAGVLRGCGGRPAGASVEGLPDLGQCVNQRSQHRCHLSPLGMDMKIMNGADIPCDGSMASVFAMHGFGPYRELVRSMSANRKEK